MKSTTDEQQLIGLALMNVHSDMSLDTEQVLHALLDFCYVYIDDVLVTDERKVHVCMILEHFQLYGILNNPTKCVLGVGELQFLGYHDNQHGISPPEDQVQVI